MKYNLRKFLIIFIIAIALVILSTWIFLNFESNRNLEIQQSEILVPPVKGNVEFYFLECAGKISVFILDNQTDHSIFTRVHRADYWKNFKDANLQFGVYLTEYKSPDAKIFEDTSGRWDAVEPFTEILPNSKIRYGIDLIQTKGEHIVKIPYLDNAKIAQRYDSDFVNKNIEAVKHNITFWKEVKTNVITNQCY